MQAHHKTEPAAPLQAEDRLPHTRHVYPKATLPQARRTAYRLPHASSCPCNGLVLVTHEAGPLSTQQKKARCVQQAFRAERAIVWL